MSSAAPDDPGPLRPDRSELRRLELTVRRRIDGARTGEHPGLALGSGSDAEELVAYQPGHDVRRIDWNATARAGEPQVWLTRAEHALDTWILVDRSPSMAFGTAGAEKLDLGIWVAAAIGLLTRGADRVGLVLADADGTRWIPPGGGPVAARRVLVEPSAPREGTVAASPLAIALSRFAARAPRQGLRVVITDLVDPDGVVDGPFDWEAPLKRLASRHDTVLVEVVDPRELELPDVGELVLVDPETGAQREISTSNRRLRTAYAEAAARHRVATAAAVRAAGADHLLLRTDDDPARALARFIRRRHRMPARPRRRTS